MSKKENDLAEVLHLWFETLPSAVGTVFEGEKIRIDRLKKGGLQVLRFRTPWFIVERDLGDLRITLHGTPTRTLWLPQRSVNLEEDRKVLETILSDLPEEVYFSTVVA